MSIVAIEAGIVGRLVAAMKDTGLVREVYAQNEYSSIAETAMVTPSVAVIYTGYTAGQRVANAKPAVQEVVFGWMVVVNVRNAKGSGTGAGVREDASPLFDAALEAVIGTRPAEGFTPLQLESAPGAAITDAGFGYYPIAFSTKKTYRGTP